MSPHSLVQVPALISFTTTSETKGGKLRPEIPGLATGSRTPEASALAAGTDSPGRSVATPRRFATRPPSRRPRGRERYLRRQALLLVVLAAQDAPQLLHGPLLGPPALHAHPEARNPHFPGASRKSGLPLPSGMRTSSPLSGWGRGEGGGPVDLRITSGADPGDRVGRVFAREGFFSLLRDPSSGLSVQPRNT